jgi:hypothetical protein
VVAARGWAEHSTRVAVDGPDGAEGELGKPFIGVLGVEMFEQCNLGCTMPPLRRGSREASGRREAWPAQEVGAHGRGLPENARVGLREPLEWPWL